MKNDLPYHLPENILENYLIADAEGSVREVGAQFNKYYKLPAEQVLGRQVRQLEEEKVFSPSVTLRVLKSGRPEWAVQTAGKNSAHLCRGYPLFDKDNVLRKVVCLYYSLDDLAKIHSDYLHLKSVISTYFTPKTEGSAEPEPSGDLVGSGASVREVYKELSRIAKFDASVCLTGESGVGKSHYAKILHQLSNLSHGPFISINCASIPENLLEAELFGYEKGAFTGAKNEGKPGMIELSHNGTLFLDEIGDFSLPMQAKLLKVIQEKKIVRVGGTREKKINFRLITATNCDLVKGVQNGTFRRDLFYRIHVVPIYVPALRERREDIIPLVNYYTHIFNDRYQVEHEFSNQALNVLEAYDWPGNIRQLQNIVERTILTARDYLIPEEGLPEFVLRAAASRSGTDLSSLGGMSLKETLEAVERRLILEAHKKYKTTTEMARHLGISQPSVSIKLRKYLDSSRKA